MIIFNKFASGRRPFGAGGLTAGGPSNWADPPGLKVLGACSPRGYKLVSRVPPQVRQKRTKLLLFGPPILIIFIKINQKLSGHDSAVLPRAKRGVQLGGQLRCPPSRVFIFTPWLSFSGPAAPERVSLFLNSKVHLSNISIFCFGAGALNGIIIEVRE